VSLPMVITPFIQRCCTRVKDLDSSPVLRVDLTHSDLNLIFKVFLHFSLMENPDSLSEILNHLL